LGNRVITQLLKINNQTMNSLVSNEQLQALKNQYGVVYVIGFNHATLQVGVLKIDDSFTEIRNDLEGEVNPQPLILDPNFDPEYPSCDFVFKKMDFDLFAASAALAMEKPIQALKMQMEATCVFGDKALLSDPVVLGSLSVEFAKITKARSASLKKNYNNFRSTQA
jgi:hypothetical protein